jgi:hypothetical protein
MQWWTDARFGLFIHWGLYALPARNEWVRKYERLTDADYRIGARAEARLNAIGDWMRFNSRSIYGCTQAPGPFKAPANCLLTYNANTTCPSSSPACKYR